MTYAPWADTDQRKILRVPNSITEHKNYKNYAEELIGAK